MSEEEEKEVREFLKEACKRFDLKSELKKALEAERDRYEFGNCFSNIELKNPHVNTQEDNSWYNFFNRQ